VKARDLLEISFGNLRRMKLRASLTVSGVIIAIAAFVSMVSFGAGIQQNVATEYEKLGLFTTMQALPYRGDDHPDSIPAGTLNEAAVNRLGRLPGVKLAYPFDDLSVSAKLDTTTIKSEAQALSMAALQTRMFSHFVAGHTFDSTGMNQAIVSREFLREFDIEEPDSVIGRTLILSVESTVLDSGLAALMSDPDGTLRERLRRIELDSLLRRDYRNRVLRTELSAAAQRFVTGYMKHLATTSDTLTIVGVLDQPGGHRLRVKPIIVSEPTARLLSSAGTGPSPAALLGALQSGDVGGLFGSPEEDTTTETFARVTLDLEATANYAVLKDSIEAMGLRAFSYAEQFQEIRRFFFYFDMVLGLVGLIALVTASLGIVNTMVMSIIERTREIGILKSLGADERDIRLQFLVESSVIGSIGAVLGILLGWVITLIASLVAQKIMENQGVPPVQLFALPWWLIMTAFLFGFLVSLVAGLYPAARAARVDPVQALRND